MKSKLKIICLVLSILMVVVCISGCNGTGTSKNTENSTAALTTANLETTQNVNPFEKQLEISWLGQNGQEIQDGNWIQKRLEEKFNVKLINKQISINANDEQINLMLSSGEMPDACMLYIPAIKMYDQKLIRTIPASLIKQYMPDYSKLLDNNPPGWLMNQAPDTKDEYMCLTGVAKNLEGPIMMPHYRLDWLEKLGYKPHGDLVQVDDSGKIWFTSQPFSLSEVEEIFSSFANKDPDGNNKKDTYALSGCNYRNFSWSSLMGMYGIQVGDISSHNNTNVDGKAVDTAICPQYKDLLKLMSSWYAKGLIDPEFVTLDLSKLWEKIASGKVGYWQNPFGYVDIKEPGYQTRPPASLLNRDPNAKVLITAPEVGPDGKSGTQQWTAVNTLDYTFYINKNVDDEKLIRILQMFDYINYDKEARVWTQFGEEGTHFTWEGEPGNSRPIMKEGIKAGADTGFGFYNLPTYENDFLSLIYSNSVWKIAKWTTNPDTGAKSVIRSYKWDLFNVTKLNDVTTQYGEGLDTISNEFYLKAITGELNIDNEWDNYVKRWKEVGGDKILEELDKAPIVDDLRKGIFK